MKVSLGCGMRLLEGYENVETYAAPGARVVDLDWSWPWGQDSLEEIQAPHVLERLYSKAFTMNEAWRCLKHGGLLAVAVYTTDGPGAWANPAHQTYWNRGSFDYYEEGNEKAERYRSITGNIARFTVMHEVLRATPAGPELFILLRAVKTPEEREASVEEQDVGVF